MNFSIDDSPLTEVEKDHWREKEQEIDDYLEQFENFWNNREVE